MCVFVTELDKKIRYLAKSTLLTAGVMSTNGAQKYLKQWSNITGISIRESLVGAASILYALPVMMIG